MIKIRLRGVVRCASALTVASLLTLPASAIDFFWNVAGPADWNVGTNWDPEGPPSGGGSNHGRVNNGGIAEISADIPDIQDVFVGDGAGSSGTLNQSGGTIHGGAAAQNGWTFVGQNGGTGTYNLSGGASDNERLYIGRLGGNGTVDISGTGLVQWATTPGAGEFVVGIDEGSVGTATMSGDGAVNTGLVLFGVGGPVENLATAMLAMSDNASITSSGNIEFQNAQVTITDNASIDAGSEIWVGQAAGRSATLDMDSGSAEADTWIAIGRDSSTGVVNLSGDAVMRKVAVDDGDPNVVSNSEGSFIIIGGLGAGGTGTLNVSENAVVESDTGILMGESFGGAMQHGVVNQSGGTVTVHDFTPMGFQPNYGASLALGLINDLGAISTGTGTYNLSGGELNADTIQLNNGHFNKTGGTLNFTTFEMNGGVLSADVFDGDLNQDGGTVSPGASPGTMTIMGNYSLNSGDLAIEIEGAAAGTGYDQLIVTGDVSLSGGLTLSTTLTGGQLSNGQTFTIIDNQGGNPIGGTLFTGAGEGDTVFAGNVPFSISYMGGTGNDVVLTSLVPEPTSIALSVLVLAGLVGLRRRR